MIRVEAILFNWFSNSSSKISCVHNFATFLSTTYHPGGSLLGESRQKALEKGVRGEECGAFSCVPPSHYRTPRWSSPSPWSSSSWSWPSPTLWSSASSWPWQPCAGLQLQTDLARITLSSPSETSSRRSLLTILGNRRKCDSQESFLWYYNIHCQEKFYFKTSNNKFVHQKTVNRLKWYTW